MNKYVITCCSTCDLTAEHLRNLGVDYALYHYIIDGVDHRDDLFTGITPAEFYGLIDSGALPTTAQVTPEELIDLLEPHLSAGEDVLHIEFSSGLSGGWQSALAAKEILDKKYPKRKLLLVDSLAASSGYGLLVDKAVELKNSGLSIEEVAKWLEENKLKLRHWFFSNNLKHFKRGGRISGMSAMIGSILGICPVMDVNSEGKLIVRKKPLGKKKAIKTLYDLMCEQAVGGEDYSGKCYISHALSPDEAAVLANMVSSGFKNLDGEVEIDNIGTVIGSHTGPGCVALFFFGSTDRTK